MGRAAAPSARFARATGGYPRSAGPARARAAAMTRGTAMGETTSNRKDHKEDLERAQSSRLSPEMGKKGGELPTGGHGPATRKNPEHRGTGGKDKDKKKSD